MPARIDLHSHTTASDGRLSPTELIERASTDGIDVLGVSDHDTVGGIDEALAAGTRLGVEVVASIELSARHEGRNVHVLGPFVDHTSAMLLDTLASLRADRERRGAAIVEKLRELGYEMTMEDVLAQSGSGVIARPHIARALVVRGHVATVRDAFTPEFIADGGRADVPKRALSPVEAVQLIRAAGGAPVVAHPGVGHHDGAPRPMNERLLRDMRDAGMAGIEVDHPDHDPLMRDRLSQVATDLGLIQCGGSDYHGDEGQALGRDTTTPESLAALQAAARA